MSHSIATCSWCGFAAPPTSHYGSRVCHALVFVANMEGRSYARIPERRWKRAFKKAGIPVVHGPISANRQGNWAPKEAIDLLYQYRRHAVFKRLPFHIQVEAVAWWLKHGPPPLTVSP